MSEKPADIREQRIEKLKKMRESGVNPYPNRFERKDKIADVRAAFDADKPVNVVVAGRIKSKRVMGKASFGNVEDFSGSIQFYAARDLMGEEGYNLYKTHDLGDHVGIEGETFLTQKGEMSIKVKRLVLLSKCIQPLPVVKEKDGQVFDEFSDTELKYRRRYVDLIVNQKTRRDFLLRSRIVSSIRRFLETDGFLEVETPMMHSVVSGAAAKPFITHHNTLDLELYLRIAPELYLKRLIVGGFERVFEMNRNFRNEGIDTRHNPEFTMVEIYQAYADYKDMMDLTERLFTGLAEEYFESTEIPYQGQTINLRGPWRRVRFVDAIKEVTGLDFSLIKTASEAVVAAKSVGIETDESMGIWKIADEVLGERVEKTFQNPTFLIDYPKELSPLSKSFEDNPDYVERFELFIAGREIANAFTELNDPFDQKERFEGQSQMRDKGDDEAMMVDDDYITALEYGLPPTGGLGIGIDRLVMLFVDTASIKDTILFPLLRPEV
ncbi:MAG: lysine--tRNA ligase [Spirochaetes bacterium]|nr:lysine--tRNA ligase [Spirochaetota bacterium]MBN2770051.1 lysine--tRNA ligase [Spirochaetota bacterium]